MRGLSQRGGWQNASAILILPSPLPHNRHPTTQQPGARRQSVWPHVFLNAAHGPIPTLASSLKLRFRNELQTPEKASASEIIAGLLLNHYSGKIRQSLATTGYAPRLV